MSRTACGILGRLPQGGYLFWKQAPLPAVGTELSRYCRERKIFVKQLESWR